MGNFFSSNGFDVLDQTGMANEDIQFSNAWGVCDEDLFRFAVKNADRLSGNLSFSSFLRPLIIGPILILRDASIFHHTLAVMEP